MPDHLNDDFLPAVFHEQYRGARFCYNKPLFPEDFVAESHHAQAMVALLGSTLFRKQSGFLAPDIDEPGDGMPSGLGKWNPVTIENEALKVGPCCVLVEKGLIFQILEKPSKQPLTLDAFDTEEDVFLLLEDSAPFDGQKDFLREAPTADTYDQFEYRDDRFRFNATLAKETRARAMEAHKNQMFIKAWDHKKKQPAVVHVSATAQSRLRRKKICDELSEFVASANNVLDEVKLHLSGLSVSNSLLVGELIRQAVTATVTSEFLRTPYVTDLELQRANDLFDATVRNSNSILNSLFPKPLESAGTTASRLWLPEFTRNNLGPPGFLKKENGRLKPSQQSTDAMFERISEGKREVINVDQRRMLLLTEKPFDGTVFFRRGAAEEQSFNFTASQSWRPIEASKWAYYTLQDDRGLGVPGQAGVDPDPAKKWASVSVQATDPAYEPVVYYYKRLL
jgi:hypothetical protein